jgi:uncharacterized protein (TIGR00369 family)
MSKPNAEEIERFLSTVWKTRDGEPRLKIEEMNEALARVRMPMRPSHLRPGATISGPTLMTLADATVWAQILHNLGLEAAPSVTSNLNINFLSRPSPGDLVAEARLLKLGSRLAVSEVRMFCEGRVEPVAHAVVTYAILKASERAQAPETT